MWKKRSNFTNRFFRRLQPKLKFIECLKMGMKGLITITALGAIGKLSGQHLIIAPFAASCITIYTAPREEFAQPMNVIGGYLMSSTIGIIALLLLPNSWWVFGLVLSVTITLMAYARITHPPAAAIPFIMFIYHSENAVTHVMVPAMLGSFGLVLMALLLHNIPFAKREYPKK